MTFQFSHVFRRSVLDSLVGVVNNARTGASPEDPSSAGLLKPFLRGRDVKRWRVEPHDRYLIKIESSENKRHPWSGSPEHEAEQVFAGTYPAIHAHLGAFRPQLLRRDDQGKYFWELRSCVYWQQFDQPKIIYPDIWEHPSFAVDTQGYYSGNTCYFISTAETWLCGLLNSRTFEWFYRQVSSQVRGGYLRAFTDYMKHVPIPTTPEPQAIQARVDRIVAARQTAPTADVSALEREIDQVVYQLYGLTPEEIRIVEESTGGGHPARHAPA